MITINRVIYPADKTHLKNIHTGEIYPGEIIPAKSLSEADFAEVTEAEYQAYISAEEDIPAEEALSIITGGSET